MSIRDQLSETQWKALFNAPSAATVYVATASGGAFEMIREVVTASRFMQETIQNTGGSDYGPLVTELLGIIKEMTTAQVRENALKIEGGDPFSSREEVRRVVVDGLAAAATLPGADGYKRWILDTARRVAETKSGGFLGIGAKSVIDEQEQAALDELAALDLPTNAGAAPPPPAV